ncbi:MAG TPA: hypothetical protein RMH85_13665 [Polyangiaceae bacterium LLY-WYZ-15_(1-7)]|nr:hypothetical protein [Sandaracinus sp.]HJK95512.1 hypothetical protein [Polyangiaceae bacterium LLY-WYZ-15_(1-7)]HJL01921.1 hypothetical protein [Polyangiaceae bacterium LLY-WYZ-15_(1-7)]HJL09546.1 hypothetical protein [Polyangiaceae bacterium LLY-WYZ-15_(1-7)]HJL26543.1 hypothetical protein [Polyangiaceae bacterium LLY-WYZ-15_(1-7)]
MKKLLICSMLVGALAACGDDDGRDGPITLMDSGTSPGTDAGTTPTMDGGSTMTEDAGGPTGACAEMVAAIPAAALPRCSASTVECINGCMDGMCQQSCLEADMTAADMATGLDCLGCFNYQVLYCADNNGCHDQIAAFNCCAEENGCTGASCPACNAEIEAVNTCIGGLAMGVCNSDLLACFPSM